MTQKKIDAYYEKLARLYLRLKGYFVTNLIIHSSTSGDLSTEIDIIGVRFPFHRQDDRKVNVPDILECSHDSIEIIIADVKNVNKVEYVKFNPGLRSNRASIEKLIKWIGCFNSIDDSLLDKFEDHLNLHRDPQMNGFSEFAYDNEFGKFLFKFTFFCPSLSPWSNKGFKYICADELLDFTWECLNQINIIETCSRTYNYDMWNEHSEMVEFFKKENHKVTKEVFERWVGESSMKNKAEKKE